MIQLTEAAASALHSAIATVSTSIAGLHLVVQSRGCAGFQYEMGLVEHVKPEEISCESRGVKIWLDPSSVAMISGTTIDFIDSQEGTGFSFDNPNARSKGGCGKSCCRERLFEEIRHDKDAGPSFVGVYGQQCDDANRSSRSRSHVALHV
jgi:iron-sulfur cluster assembly accessory protein